MRFHAGQCKPVQRQGFGVVPVAADLYHPNDPRGLEGPFLVARDWDLGSSPMRWPPVTTRHGLVRGVQVRRRRGSSSLLSTPDVLQTQQQAGQIAGRQPAVWGGDQQGNIGIGASLHWLLQLGLRIPHQVGVPSGAIAQLAEQPPALPPI